MHAPSIPRASGASGRRQFLLSSRIAFCTGLLLAPLLQGCAGAPGGPITSRDPVDPGARTKPVAYRSVIGPYASQRPTDPVGWREQNERVAPSSSGQ